MELDFELGPAQDLPLDAFRRLRETGPVVWSPPLGGWLVSSHEAVREVFGDLTRFTSAGTPVAESMGAQAMLVDDTRLHHTIRSVWSKRVSREALAGRREEIDGFARMAVETARPRLAAGETVDLIPVFRTLVMAFIASSFGVPREGLGALERWSELSADTPALQLEPGSAEHARHAAARGAVFELLREQVADRRNKLRAGASADDLIGLMVAAEGRDGITDSVVLDNLFNFMLGAMDTTEKWMGNIVLRICGTPGTAAELRADRSLIEPFNEEVMRLDTVAQVIQRRVRKGGACLGGQQLKGGDAVFLLLGAANRDPAVFERPDAFDLRRSPSPHLGFGSGFHHCLGVHIARQEARALISALLDAFAGLRIADVDRGRSWALWGPRALIATWPAGSSSAGPASTHPVR